MKYSQSVIAKPYAKAFLNEYESELNIDDVHAMKNAVWFFKRHPDFISLLNILLNNSDIDHSIVQELFDHFALPQKIKKLLLLLQQHQKITIFAQVLQDICCLYGIRNNMLELTIFTAHELADKDRKKFESFFQKQAKKNLITSVCIDESLISGIRMQSDLYLWEYSIASRLKQLRQNMLAKG